MFEVEGGPRLELPEEPVDIKTALRDALLDGQDWREGFSDDICVGLWLWRQWRPALEPDGLSREEFVDAVDRLPARAVAVAHRRPPVAAVHHRAGRQDRPPAAGATDA